jgi:SAM-dependent methyltransferase
MSDRIYAIHSDGECERLEAQALLAGVSDHVIHVPAQPGMRILDAGCGSGSMAREIAKAASGSTVLGIDLRDKYVDYARRRAQAEGLQNLTFEAGDVRALPFPDGAFDIVWTKYLLQWVAEPMRAVRKFARVRRPGGVLVTANFDGFAVTHEPPDPAIQPMTEFVFGGLVDPFIGRKMAGMCRAAGLIDIDVKMEVDRVFTVIGKIDPDRRHNWEIQLSAARDRIAELLGSQTHLLKHSLPIKIAQTLRRIAHSISSTRGNHPDKTTSSSNPMMEGPWCRFRREARARERHRCCGGG